MSQIVPVPEYQLMISSRRNSPPAAVLTFSLKLNTVLQIWCVRCVFSDLYLSGTHKQDKFKSIMTRYLMTFIIQYVCTDRLENPDIVKLSRLTKSVQLEILRKATILSPRKYLSHDNHRQSCVMLISFVFRHNPAEEIYYFVVHCC